MAILKCISILMVVVPCTLSLLVWVKYPSDPPGNCTLPDGKVIEVGTHVSHDDMCANYFCWKPDGTAVISYCQIPVPFQECNETGVWTYGPYPDCCYQCSQYVDC